MGPLSNDKCPYERGKGEKTHRGEGPRETEAEIRLTQLQAKECQGLPAAAQSSERGRNRFSPEPPEGADPAYTWISDPGPPEL